MFITVPISALAPHMNRLEQHTAFMQDQEGNIVTLFGDSNVVRQLNFSLPSGSSVTGSDGKPYICNYTQSEITGWHYAVVVSAENYWSKLRSAQLLNFLGVLLALFLGTCLVSLFLRHNYRPVHKIVGLLKPSVPYGNEFELIENSYRSLSEENSFMRVTLNRQTAQLRERFLLSWLKGRSSPLISSDYNTHFEIAEKGETLLLIVFSVGISESSRDGYRDELEYENMNLFAADNIFSEMMDAYPYYRLEDGKLLMYLMHLDESAWHSWNKLGLPLLEKLCDIFTSKLSVPLAATVSSPAETLDALPYLYRSTMDAIEYCNTIGSTGVLTVADYQKQTETLQTRREEEHQDILHAVREGDAAAGENVLRRIFDEYAANTSMTFPIFRLFLTEQLYTIVSAYYEAVSDPGHRETLIKRGERVIFSQDMGQLREAFYDLVSFACNSVQMANAAVGNQLVQKICRYVQENYQDNNLNINAIAEALHHNPQYISRIFHSQMHKGLLDYINEVRIQHACSLMCGQSITADELAEQVSFTNARTFRRAFSRVVGSTPGQYRQRGN